MKYRPDDPTINIDFQGQRDRGRRWLEQGDRPAGRPNFVRDLRVGENQLGEILSPRRDFMRLAVALAEQGPEGKTMVLMLAVAFVGGAVIFPALTSHPVSADTGFGHSPVLLSADCDVPVKRADIFAVTSGGGSAEVSFNDGLKAMPPDPSAENLACRFRQIAAALTSGELKPHDVETERHLGLFFGRGADNQLLADIKPWNNLTIDPAKAADGTEMGLILIDKSRNMAEPLLEQVSWYYARANGYEPRPGSPSRGAIIAYTLLNDIFGFAGEFNSEIRSTCVTHQGRAASRFSQQTVVIDRAVWTPRIAVGSERSIFFGNPELRSSDARIGILFREMTGKSNVDALIRSLRAEKLDAVAVEISKGKFLVVAGFDPESKNVDFPGLRTFAAGDRDQNKAVGDGAWFVRCGPSAPVKPKPPTSLTPLAGPALTETAKSPSTPLTPRTPGTPGSPTPPVGPTETPSRSTESPSSTPQNPEPPREPGPTAAGTPVRPTPIPDTPAPVKTQPGPEPTTIPVNKTSTPSR